MKDHQTADKAHTIEGPAGYNGKRGPDKKELGAPVKVYPDSSKIPWGKKTDIEGPCKGKEGYKE
jgi:hypothetical protein